MIVTVLGAACVGAGCAGIGFLAFMRLENRVRLLSAFAGLCDRLASEIGFRLTPLPELAGRLENPVLQKFWSYIQKHYALFGGETYAEVWKQAVMEMDLPEIDRMLISDMGDVLGSYDAENQTRSLSVIREQLAISLEMARERRQKQGRMAGMMGILCGALLIVVLI